MRARNIKPAFYKNEQLAECSLMARFIFPGLWMLADRMGRLEYRPKRIKGELLPYDNADVPALLEELELNGLIKIYEVDGKKYIWILAFLAHQNPHLDEPTSVLPRHPDDKNPEGYSRKDKAKKGQVRCLHSADTISAPYQNSADTIQAQCKYDTDTVSVRLNHESGIMNHESISHSESGDTSTAQPQRADGYERDSFETMPTEEPRMDFVELRDFYDREIRPEAPLAGYVEYKALKKNRSSPSHFDLMRDISQRLESGMWDKGYEPGLARYLRERTWEGEISPRHKKESTSRMPRN